MTAVVGEASAVSIQQSAVSDQPLLVLGDGPRNGFTNNTAHVKTVFVKPVLLVTAVVGEAGAVSIQQSAISYQPLLVLGDGRWNGFTNNTANVKAISFKSVFLVPAVVGEAGARRPALNTNNGLGI